MITTSQQPPITTLRINDSEQNIPVFKIDVLILQGQTKSDKINKSVDSDEIERKKWRSIKILSRKAQTVQNVLGENLSASSISNYDCILSPFFLPHPSERNAITIIQLSDKSTDDFSVIYYTDESKIDGRVGFAFVVFRSGAESAHFQFRIRDEYTVFVAELLCLNFAIKWITEQNRVISEYVICTDSLSS
ncbi:RNase H domain-containing protein [Trichonephila clavipes]|nr:RNase H domain-containing protein [Trichonephila clavipes]